MERTPNERMYRIISESGWSGDTVLFEHVDMWEIIRWFALNSPEPELIALDAGFRVEGPDGFQVSGPQIDKWIHGLACSQCGKSSDNHDRNIADH